MLVRVAIRARLSPVFRVILAGLAVAVASVVVLLLVELGTGRDSSPIPEQSAPVSEGREPAPGEPPVGPRPSLPAEESDGGVLDGEPQRQEQLAAALARKGTRVFLTREVPQQILGAASGCYRGTENEHERMTVRYRARFEGGVGRLGDVAVVNGELGAPELEDCVLSAMKSLEIRGHLVPDVVEDLHITISVASLKRASARRASSARPQ